ncbi:MAG: hypothetical protein WCD69_11130 [Xanthobacteraceae bacterium]
MQNADERDRDRHAPALSYLRQLKQSGYFSKPHTCCDGGWFLEHPACKDNDTWRSVGRYSVEHGYVGIERTVHARSISTLPGLCCRLSRMWQRLGTVVEINASFTIGSVAGVRAGVKGINLVMSVIGRFRII